MKYFCFHFWSNSEWSWMWADVIANSREEAEVYLRKNTSVDPIPYQKETKDSLKLIDEAEFTVPGFIDGPGRRDW